jgi:hypothetical protein
MTSYELETYELLIGQTFSDENPMPQRLRKLHARVLELAQHVGVRTLSKDVMALIAVMADGVEEAPVAPVPVLGPRKRRPGRPTNKEREERARLEEQVAEVT